ncbi:MAG: DUF1735 domain-containing protein [Ferruginibacter sp.]|nr:DUF1735 domain-containing protein [Ferruginibacter sp.]
MKKNLLKYTRACLALLVFSALFYSCKKAKIIETEYPAQVMYISQSAVAAVGPNANGVYAITPNIPAQAYRFIVDAAAAKFNVPLGVIRSGVDLSGNVSAGITVSTDTIAKAIFWGNLPAGTEVLPATAYTLPASVDVINGSGYGTFTLAIDLNFLRTNLSKKYAVAVSISNPKSVTVNPKLSLALIYIEPAQVLVPVASFSNYIDNPSKTASFINFSANGISYSWNFGDGSPADTTVSPSHKYALPGTYTVTLTTTGIAGTGIPSVLPATVVIP